MNKNLEKTTIEDQIIGELSQFAHTYSDVDNLSQFNEALEEAQRIIDKPIYEDHQDLISGLLMQWINYIHRNMKH